MIVVHKLGFMPLVLTVVIAVPTYTTVVLLNRARLLLGQGCLEELLGLPDT